MAFGYDPLVYRPPQERNAFLDFAQGLQLAQGQQQRETQNALLQRKMALEEQQAGMQQKKFGLETKKEERALQKSELDAVKPALDFFYSMTGVIEQDPTKYPEILAQTTKLAPMTKSFWPTEYNATTIANFRKNYEKMKKLEDYKVHTVAPGAALVSPTGKELYKAEDRPKEYAPQWFEDEEGNGSWVKPGEEPPLGSKPSGRFRDTDYSRFAKRMKEQYPGLSDEEIRQKWSLKGEADIPKWAIDKATNELNKNKLFQDNLNPETEKPFKEGEKDTYIEQRAQSYMTQREKLRGGKKGGKQVTAPTYPNSVNSGGLTYTKTDRVDPQSGKPIYQAPDGSLVLPK